jgi:hypothetical protein
MVTCLCFTERAVGNNDDLNGCFRLYRKGKRATAAKHFIIGVGCKNKKAFCAKASQGLIGNQAVLAHRRYPLNP